jgi:hypothetical protein
VPRRAAGLHESALFWVAFVGVLVVIGGVVTGIANKPNPDGWFWFGLGVVGIGFLSCKEIGWEEPKQPLIALVNPEHMELGYAWADTGHTITSIDVAELRKLGRARGEIARQIRDTALGRIFRETYVPQRQPPGML